MLRFVGMIAALQLAGLAHAEDVAQVLAVDGTVNITRASGAIVPADPRVGLERGDTVQTGEDGAVILLLSNSRLVRVDEELELKVGDIALLTSAKTTVPPAQQLDALLYPGEREHMRGIDDAERIAGWQARLSAATAIPAQREARTAPGATSLAASGAGEGGGGAGSIGLGALGGPGGGATLVEQQAADAPTVEPVAPAEDEVAEEAQDAAPMDDAKSTERDEREASKSSPPSPRSAPPPPPPPALEHLSKDGIVAMFGKGGELYACAKEWRKASGLAAGTDTLIVFRLASDGTILRVVGDRGVAPPMCVRTRLEGLSSVGSYAVIDGVAAGETDAVSVSIRLP